MFTGRFGGGGGGFFFQNSGAPRPAWAAAMSCTGLFYQRA